MAVLYLIDGNSYIYRAYYAIRGLSTSTGIPTNAIYGFINMILKILREKDPDLFGIVFDAPGPTHRHDTYEEYKAHRPSMPDDLKIQIPHIKDMINAFRIKMVEEEGYEADDILAALAQEAEKRGIDTYIVTADKDMCQIVSPKIRLYDTMRERITGEREVLERYGINPSQFPEIIALMGDASDNIPGAKGIGEKTAVMLIREFGNLENLLNNIDKIKNSRIRDLIKENIENIKLSLRLAKVEPRIPPGLRLEDFQRNEPDWKAVFEHFRKFEFASLIRSIPETSIYASPEVSYKSVLDIDTLRQIISSIRDEVVIDTETTSENPFLADLVGISICIDKDEAFYIPISHSYLNVPRQIPRDQVIAELRQILENPDIKKYGHNIKYDLIVLRNEGITLKGIGFDTMIASYLINPNRANHRLEDVVVEYLGYRKMSFDEVMGKDIKDFSHVRIEDATRYSGEDAVMTLRLKEVLEEKIRDEGLERVFYEIEIPLIDVLADMEQYGIKIDVEIMKRLSEEIDKELAEIEKSIYSASGEEFNINSPKQLQDVLFTKLGLKPVKRTKTGYSTNMDVLEQLANEHPLPRMIIEYRTLSKLKSTYIDALPRMIHPHTGRIHTSFNQTVTATGRLSSSEPNLQNIPIRGEWGTKIREAFIADKGFILLSSDYSQIELRILAHLSNDSNLIKIFTSDGDIHASTASEIFGVPPEDVTPDMRRSAKSVNFGIVYGISPFGLGQQLNISPEEAKGYIERYFKKHKGVKNYIEAQIMRAKKNGYVETITGRKRAIPELRSKNKSTKQLGERLAVNTPIQGSAADIIKIAMINISKRIREEGLRTRLILQVHDELLFEVPEDEIEIAEEIIRYEMENAVTLRVPLKVDIGKGKNWAETH